MSSNPRWWPYRISVEDAFKRGAFAVLGLVVGANVVSYYWKPLQVNVLFNPSRVCESHRTRAGRRKRLNHAWSIFSRHSCGQYFSVQLYALYPWLTYSRSSYYSSRKVTLPIRIRINDKPLGVDQFLRDAPCIRLH
uniref:Uncharacterized protein n=1 Tax=Angiostrongylus cantonensis TaxID=6313 RepID=A0A0K0DER2_ANGCA